MDTTKNKNKKSKETSDEQPTTQMPITDAGAFDKQVQDVHDTVLVSGDLIREELRRRGVLEEEDLTSEPARPMPAKPATAQAAPAKPAPAPAAAARNSAASEPAPAEPAPAKPAASEPAPASPGRTPVVDVTDDAGDEKPCLLVDAEHSKFRVDLGEDAIVIGRAKECDLVIPSLTVSRQHARITSSEKGWWLHDLGADNGTYLNGERVGETALMDGDVIQAGDAKITFHLPESCTHDLPTVMRVLPPATPEKAPAQAAAAQPAKNGGGKGLLILVVVMLMAVCAMLVILMVKSNVLGTGGGSEEQADDTSPKTAAVLADPAPSPPPAGEASGDEEAPGEEQDATEAAEADAKPAEDNGAQEKPDEVAKTEAKPAEDDGAGEKPAEVAEAEAKPAEDDGAGEKPAEVAEAEAKPAEDDGAEKKPDEVAEAEAKPDENDGAKEKPAEVADAEEDEAEAVDAAKAEAKPADTTKPDAGEDKVTSTKATKAKKPVRQERKASSEQVVGRKVARHTPRERKEAAGGSSPGVFERPSGILLRAQSLQAYLAGDVKSAIETARESGVRSDGIDALKRIERIHARCYELYRTSKQSRPVEHCLHDALELDSLLGGGKGKLRRRIRSLLSQYHTHLAVAARKRGDQPEAYRQSVLALGFDAGFEKARKLVLELAGEARGLYDVAREKQHLEPARAVQLCERAMKMVPTSSGIHQRCRDLISRLTRSPG